jgi:hypothetical protein
MGCGSLQTYSHGKRTLLFLYSGIVEVLGLKRYGRPILTILELSRKEIVYTVKNGVHVDLIRINWASVWKNGSVCTVHGQIFVSGLKSGIKSCTVFNVVLYTVKKDSCQCEECG